MELTKQEALLIYKTLDLALDHSCFDEDNEDELLRLLAKMEENF